MAINAMKTENNDALKAKLKKQIEQLKQEESYYNAMQMAQKLVLNSWYGAFLNKYFALHNSDIGAAITAAGRDLIQHMDKSNQIYFYTLWHKDTDTHKIFGAYFKWINEVNAYINKLKTELGNDEFKSKYGKYQFINWLNELGHDWTIAEPVEVEKINADWINKASGEITTKEDFKTIEEWRFQAVETELINRKNPVSCYCDTDSLFVGMGPMLDSIKSHNVEGHEEQLIHLLYNFKLKKYFNDILDEYAADKKKFNTSLKNVQDFEMERINESVLFIQKKTYVQHVRWEDGTAFERLSYLYPKNVSLMKHTTPPFARTQIRKIIDYIFDNPKNKSIGPLLKLVKDIKLQFELQTIEDISETTSCNNYKDYVLEDEKNWTYIGGVPFGVKASSYYNFRLNSKPELKKKYELIKSGNKVKIYYCKHDTNIQPIIEEKLTPKFDSKGAREYLKDGSPAMNKQKIITFTKDENGKVGDLNDRFAYLRGMLPMEIAPKVDYDKQFEKVILDNINKYIVAMGHPELNKRLSVITPLF